MGFIHYRINNFEKMTYNTFSDAISHLFETVRLSVHPSIYQSIHLSVGGSESSQPGQPIPHSWVRLLLTEQPHFCKSGSGSTEAVGRKRGSSKRGTKIHRFRIPAFQSNSGWPVIFFLFQNWIFTMKEAILGHLVPLCPIWCPSWETLWPLMIFFLSWTKAPNC